ncbi:MMPL family transporter [Demequina capsici]|uniref:MMPL family transporter n=1 Tax=Demequina capsici TaxID=3075620 RepID=A0AA96JA51_9MICO|nr:MMPL family transporter [Demequina sp. PMTSA13]WNM26593.1 MMPL family transporter [Demequina sp. PMTSA13]
MSLALHRLGRFVGRHRAAVLVGWLLLLLVVGGASRVMGSTFDENYTISGTESQEGQDVLAARFGSAATGATAQVLYRVDAGSDITTAGAQATIADSLRAIAAIDGVANVTDAGSLPVDDAGDATLATVQFTDEHPDHATLDAVEAAATVADNGVTSTIGGSSYGNGTDVGGHTSELIGITMALLVMVLTFGSLLAAGMPILTALVGVGTTLSAITLLTHVTSVSNAAPAFASMLGLAVAIDYSLFILSRHRAELAAGAQPREAMARALATSGSAVVFAGLTVVVSLVGLVVVQIPMLTVMALGGALAVTMAVLAALTLLPAVALLAGERLRPRAGRTDKAGTRVSERWIRSVTRRPLVTITAVVVVVGAIAAPAFSIRLALPDAGTQPVGTAARDHFDAVADTFGPGYNAPLLITADILGSTDPVQTVQDLSDAVAALPGVAAVSKATPNASADTALLRVIPEGGQSDPATVTLVQTIRDNAAAVEAELGVGDVRVTGTTAINIDVSQRLSDALLPFGLTVVGLSLVLLLIVFRSVAVPIKATVGYVLSVGAAFGAIVAVFQWGWLPFILGGNEPGPLVSFLPILVMGVLFGLAMDYEMFLVSRMREEYAHSGDATRAIRVGFSHSAPVVTAAAVIMVSVFVAFLPGGSTTIKPIAFGLAVGVAVDAFLVRMTLVPAVLTLLGDHAWKMPESWKRRLPTVDVEGDALVRQTAVGSSPEASCALSALDVTARLGDLPVTVQAAPGQIVILDIPDTDAQVALGAVLTGRAHAWSGDLVVDGMILPERAGEVRARSAVATPEGVDQTRTAAHEVRATLTLAGARRRNLTDRTAHALGLLAALDIPADAHLAALDEADRRAVVAVSALAAGARLIVLPGAPDHDLAALLAGHGASVVLFAPVRATLTRTGAQQLEIGA